MAEGEGLKDQLRELRSSLDALPEVSEPPKTTLRILNSARSEQQWNTLLAYFLDPSQPHGFGTDLLTSFLDKANEVTETEVDYIHRHFDKVRIDTEISSPQNNRLDILIRVPDEWFVCIEAKVDASEGERQTQRYINDSHIGNEKKEQYPVDGHHYLFLSKEFTSDSSAQGFEDIYWRHVIDAFDKALRKSHGRYPERSVSQLEDYLTNITTVTSMEEDQFTQTQKEKVRLLSEYRDEIDDLLEAAESLRQRSIDEWPELFQRQIDTEVWTEEWHTRPDHGKYGCIFRHGWYLDDEALEPTTDHEETWGDTGFRLHFVHLIRREESFSEGELTYQLRSSTNVDLRDEFHRAFNSDRWQAELGPLFEDRGITNKGNKKIYTSKTYDVDQSGLPESYFETLSMAFEDHLPVADIVDQILDEAFESVKHS